MVGDDCITLWDQPRSSPLCAVIRREGETHNTLQLDPVTLDPIVYSLLTLLPFVPPILIPVRSSTLPINGLMPSPSCPAIALATASLPCPPRRPLKTTFKRRFPMPVVWLTRPDDSVRPVVWAYSWIRPNILSAAWCAASYDALCEFLNPLSVPAEMVGKIGPVRSANVKTVLLRLAEMVNVCEASFDTEAGGIRYFDFEAAEDREVMSGAIGGAAASVAAGEAGAEDEDEGEGESRRTREDEAKEDASCGVPAVGMGRDAARRATSAKTDRPRADIVMCMRAGVCGDEKEDRSVTRIDGITQRQGRNSLGQRHFPA